MKFGVQVNCYGTSWDRIRASIEAMENGPWDSLWFADHLLPPVSDDKVKPNLEREQGTAFEGYTLIAVAAGMTRKLRLGHLVLGNPYRNPGLLAKMAATLDQASEGRFTLSLGAGWFDREHVAYGWGTFPTMRELSDRLEESAGLIRKLFTADGPVTHHGKYYRLEQAPLSPPCCQQPHLPILIGGTGEQRTLRTLAKYGDIMNYDGWAGRGMSIEVFRHKVSVLERHCEAVGRDPAEIRRSLLMPLVITDDPAAVERSKQFFGRRANTRYGNYAGRLMEAQEVEAAVGSLNEVIDLIGRFADEGVDEIMFGAIPTGDVEALQRVEQDVLAVFADRT